MLSYNDNKRIAFKLGLKHGLPIGIGYFAVAFSLGIIAAKAGLNVFQGFAASILCIASAGEYAGFTMIAASASLAELALMTFVINLRYMLMSFALSQKTDPKMPFFHRLLFGAAITDEIFAINIARLGYLNPWYFYGAMATSVPLWGLGTAVGIAAGDLLPARILSALSVALYGMFIAIIVPKAKKDKVVAVLIIVCFAASWCAEKLELFSGIGSGIKTVILIIIISSVAAILFPREEEAHDA